MQARMKNPVFILPDAMQAMLALGKAAETGGASPTILSLVNLRVSQINGCSVCVEAAFKHYKDPDERLYAVSAWRDMPHFTEAERAALALAEAVTCVGDRSEGVPDDVWNEAVRHFDEKALSAILVQIVVENSWNRFNIAVRQVAGTPWN